MTTLKTNFKKVIFQKKKRVLSSVETHAKTRAHKVLTFYFFVSYIFFFFKQTNELISFYVGSINYWAEVWIYTEILPMNLCPIHQWNCLWVWKNRMLPIHPHYWLWNLCFSSFIFSLYIYIVCLCERHPYSKSKWQLRLVS